ncbi:hypothetical protein GJ496_011841 [Pomphorhynchus laevis]|nr:hypothetical protein GJ496_011841 [Pomphorhynchus laevis]
MAVHLDANCLKVACDTHFAEVSTGNPYPPSAFRSIFENFGQLLSTGGMALRMQLAIKTTRKNVHANGGIKKPHSFNPAVGHPTLTYEDS